MGKTIILEDLLKENNITIDLLKNTYGLEAVTHLDLTTFDTAPDTVLFGGKQFMASFFFKGEKLNEIELIPLNVGVDSAGCSDKEYEKLKSNYCREVVSSIYGEPSVATEYGQKWVTDLFKIFILLAPNGKDMHNGGNISIRLR